MRGAPAGGSVAPVTKGWRQAGAWLRRLRWRAVHWAWAAARRSGMVTADTPAGQRFAAFGCGSSAAFPPGSVFGEQWITIGSRAVAASRQCAARSPFILGENTSPRSARSTSSTARAVAASRSPSLR